MRLPSAELTGAAVAALVIVTSAGAQPTWPPPLGSSQPPRPMGQHPNGSGQTFTPPQSYRPPAAPQASYQPQTYSPPPQRGSPPMPRQPIRLRLLRRDGGRMAPIRRLTDQARGPRLIDGADCRSRPTWRRACGFFAIPLVKVADWRF